MITVPLLPHQSVAEQFALQHHYCIIGDEMGLGKEQRISSPVLTLFGWKKIGDLKVGDFVIGSQGTPTKVTGVFPQGKKKIYKCTFTDGTSTECGLDHLWEVNTPTRRFRGNPPLVLSLREIIDRGVTANNGNSKWFIPLVKEVQFVETKHLIHPYVLGVLIGDGSLVDSVNFTKSEKDFEVVERVITLLPKEVKLNSRPDSRNSFVRAIVRVGNKNNIFVDEIRRLKLNSLSTKKHIPKEYLFDSVDNRIELLRGLMDTDGYVSKDGVCSQFYTASKTLSDNFAHLVQSLGGVTYYSEKEVGGKVYFTQTLSLPPHINPFFLKRKKDLFLPKKKYIPYRAFRDVELVDVDEAVCIRVDAPDSLYVTENFIVTHNTLEAIAVYEKSKINLLVVCPAFLKYNWKQEFSKFTDGTDCTVVDSDNMRQLILPLCEVLIVNYDILTRCEHLFKWARFIIADECHYLKNPQAIRTKAFYTYVKKYLPERVILMSGTPVTKSVGDWFVPITICSLNPKGTSGIDITKRFKSHWEFMMHFSNMTRKKIGSKMITEWSGVRNLDDLKAILKDKYIRRKTEEVIKLPELRVKSIIVDYKKENKELQEAYDQFVKGKVGEHISKVKKEAAMVKVKFTVDYCVDLLTQSRPPVVVFSDHIEPAETIYNMLKEKGYRCSLIRGDTDTSLRHKYVGMAMTGLLDFFVATIGAASVGITLTESDNMVRNDKSWSKVQNDQAEKRIHRIGQKNACMIHDIYGCKVDKNIQNSVESHGAVQDMAVDFKEIKT